MNPRFLRILRIFVQPNTFVGNHTTQLFLPPFQHHIRPAAFSLRQTYLDIYLNVAYLFQVQNQTDS